MADVTCKIEGCGGKVKGRGWCQLHYSRWYRFGDPAVFSKYELSGKRRVCCVDGCEAKPVYKFRCTEHAPDRPVFVAGSCKIANCDRPATAKDVCLMHYRRFRRHGTYDLGLVKTCETCETSFRTEQHNARNCPKCAERLPWASSVKLNYKLSVAEFLRMLTEQGDVCAICKRNPDGHFAVDHDHACCPGKKSCGRCVRGLLCRSCNWAIGHMQDDPQRLRAAADYLTVNLEET